MKKKIISIPPVYFLVSLVTLFLLHFLVPGMNRIPFPFTLCGIPFLFSGIFFIFGAHRSLTLSATPVNFARSTSLIKDGLYRRSRNPMYLGFVLFLLGLSLWSGNVLALVCPVFMFLILDRMFIPYEEEKMTGTFGKEYLEYKQLVRRWL
jgi:protein-S-isoprenylcysteine O-methyltransferase Ste14